MKHARLYSALPRVASPRVRSNSAASTSRALSLASSFFDAPPQTGPPPPNTRLTTHRLPIEARGEVEGPNSGSNAQAGRDAPLALVAPPHTPGNGHNTNHHHPHPAQLGALLFPGAPNHAGRHAASAPPPSGRVGRRRGQKYTLDVGAYGIPKRGNGHGQGQRVRGMHTGAGGYGAEVTDAPLAVQVGEDAYFVRENAMGVADGVGPHHSRYHRRLDPPGGPIPTVPEVIRQDLRHKLTVIFSTCVVTTIVSLVHAAFILRNGGTKVVIAALVEDYLSLVVANIPVVVTAMVDVVDDPDQVGTGCTLTTQFSTLLWFSNNAASREVPLRHIGEADVKSFSAVSSVRWNQDSLSPTKDTSEGTVVDKEQLSSSTSRADESITGVS